MFSSDILTTVGAVRLGWFLLMMLKRPSGWGSSGRRVSYVSGRLLHPPSRTRKWRLSFKSAGLHCRAGAGLHSFSRCSRMSYSLGRMDIYIWISLHSLLLLHLSVGERRRKRECVDGVKMNSNLSSVVAEGDGTLDCFL